MMRGFLMKQNTVQKQPKIVPIDTAAVRMDILIQPKSTTKSINSCQTLPELIIWPLPCPRATERPRVSLLASAEPDTDTQGSITAQVTCTASTRLSSRNMATAGDDAGIVCSAWFCTISSTALSLLAPTTRRSTPANTKMLMTSVRKEQLPAQAVLREAGRRRSKRLFAHWHHHAEDIWRARVAASSCGGLALPHQQGAFPVLPRCARNENAHCGIPSHEPCRADPGHR